MAIDDDVKISINLNKLVEARAKLLTQYEDYSNAIATGEYLDENDIDRIAVQLRETLTWDSIYFMVDTAIYDYMGLKHPDKPNYGERSIETIELTMEKERKEREKEFKKNFDLVKLESSAWTIEVPVRKKK
tara:strand:+ start:296 stop:688 length:393 start_codon:yes stop_codon:yes gene_type:complete